MLITRQIKLVSYFSWLPIAEDLLSLYDTNRPLPEGEIAAAKVSLFIENDNKNAYLTCLMNDFMLFSSFLVVGVPRKFINRRLFSTGRCTPASLLTADSADSTDYNGSMYLSAILLPHPCPSPKKGGEWTHP